MVQTRTALLILVVATGVAPACKKASWQQREVDHALVTVDKEHINLRHDTVGEGRFESQASFVLVDARNTHDTDLMVTLTGELVDGGGNPVGKLRMESLRIPAGGLRTFALIDAENALRPSATSARLEVTGAWVPGFPPPVVVSEGSVTRSDDRMVVAGTVHNTADRHVKVIVFAGFYAADGTPMTRPFTLMQLAGKSSHPAEFVGPPGASKGYLFIGQAIY